MFRTFVVKDEYGIEVSRFELALGKRDGLVYHWLEGAEPCWQDVVIAATELFSKHKIKWERSPYVYDDIFSIKPDNTIDVRFEPVLVNNKRGLEERIPVTIDYSEVFEHHVAVPFRMAVKVMRTLAMRYGEHYFEVDKEKLEKLEESKFRVSFLEKV